jgi:hypothetical protein
MSIYSAMRVPEVWRYDGTTLTFFGLQADGKYVAIATSSAFPGLSAADLLPFLSMRGQDHENNTFRTFRAWVRQRFALKP